MRVIGGEARGRQIVAPDLPGLRPTSDRVREAIFDILEARDLVEGASFLDLYAGSGALGIEALSRGAGSCTFVESERRAALSIEANLEAVGLAGGPGTRIARQDVMTYLRTATESTDVALVDPPYRYAGWPELLGLLKSTVAVLEHGGPIGEVAPFQTLRAYKYGGTLVTLVTRHPTDKDLA